jgi:hypothetical protein
MLTPQQLDSLSLRFRNVYNVFNPAFQDALTYELALSLDLPSTLDLLETQQTIAGRPSKYVLLSNVGSAVGSA